MTLDHTRTLYPRGAPGVRFYTAESPGANVVNGGGFPKMFVLMSSVERIY